MRAPAIVDDIDGVYVERPARVAQENLFDFARAEARLCRYGESFDRPGSMCDRPATHAACWTIPPLHLDGTPNHRAGAGRLECCLAHANYYASAWCPIYPAQTDAAWIEVLPCAS